MGNGEIPDILPGRKKTELLFLYCPADLPTSNLKRQQPIQYLSLSALLLGIIDGTLEQADRFVE